MGTELGDGTALKKEEDNSSFRLKSLKQKLRPNFSDMAGLTSLINNEIVGDSVEKPRIASVFPAMVSRCATNTTFAIEGEGVWRVSEVHVGGERKVTESELKICQI